MQDMTPTKEALKLHFSTLYSQYTAEGAAPREAAARALVDAHKKAIELCSPNSCAEGSAHSDDVKDASGEQAQTSNNEGNESSSICSSSSSSSNSMVAEADTPPPVSVSVSVPVPTKKLPPLPHQIPALPRVLGPQLGVALTQSLLADCAAAGAYTAVIRAAGSFFRDEERLLAAFHVSADDKKGAGAGMEVEGGEAEAAACESSMEVDPPSSCTSSSSSSSAAAASRDRSTGPNMVLDLDIAAVQQVYRLLLSCPSEGAGNSVGHALEALVSTILLQSAGYGSCSGGSGGSGGEKKCRLFFIVLEVRL